MIEEERDWAYLKITTYKQRVSQYFNKRVKHRSFQVGDLVLKAVNQSSKNPSNRKMGPNWEGSYKIT